MVYLDYSATTPVDKDVLKEYATTLVTFIANPNSINKLGGLCSNKLNLEISSIARMLNCKKDELIFTSCASESNATAIRGIASPFNKNGKHIITSKLEHKSILEEMERLSNLGYTVEYVKINDNGQVDLNDLENKIREDTILVSICGVNSEVGYKQDLLSIKNVIKSKNSKTVFHSDLTQALGKTNIDLSLVDMASFSSHKIYAPKGIGLLYKNESIIIDPLISGFTDNTKLRGGTPSVELVSAFSCAIKKFNNNIENENKCKRLNKIIIDRLSKYDIKINSNELCVPQIINFSILRKNSVSFIRYFGEYNIYLSTTTACSSLSKSIILEEIYNDEKISTTSIRMSISHLTTESEIDEFFRVFDILYKKYLS